MRGSQGATSLGGLQTSTVRQWNGATLPRNLLFLRCITVAPGTRTGPPRARCQAVTATSPLWARSFLTDPWGRHGAGDTGAMCPKCHRREQERGGPWRLQQESALPPPYSSAAVGEVEQHGGSSLRSPGRCGTGPRTPWQEQSDTAGGAQRAGATSFCLPPLLPGRMWGGEGEGERLAGFRAMRL